MVKSAILYLCGKYKHQEHGMILMFVFSIWLDTIWCCEKIVWKQDWVDFQLTWQSLKSAVCKTWIDRRQLLRSFAAPSSNATLLAQIPWHHRIYFFLSTGCTSTKKDSLLEPCDLIFWKKPTFEIWHGILSFCSSLPRKLNLFVKNKSRFCGKGKNMFSGLELGCHCVAEIVSFASDHTCPDPSDGTLCRFQNWKLIWLFVFLFRFWMFFVYN